jgi:hypothetical protein
MYLWILLLELVIRLCLPDSLSAAAFTSLDHDRIADPLSMLEAFLQGVDAGLRKHKIVSSFQTHQPLPEASFLKLA